MRIKAAWNPIHYSNFIIQQFRFREEAGARIQLMNALIPTTGKKERSIRSLNWRASMKKERRRMSIS